jgi:hypothetical protein
LSVFLVFLVGRNFTVGGILFFVLGRILLVLLLGLRLQPLLYLPFSYPFPFPIPFPPPPLLRSLGLTALPTTLPWLVEETLHGVSCTLHRESRIA